MQVPMELGSVSFALRTEGRDRAGMKQTEAFRILASADRQLVLHELVERDGETTIAELSRQVAARRHKVSTGKLDEQMADRAQVRLVHSHFPHLQAKDLVDIDWHEESVALTDEENVEELFEAAEALDSWPPTDLSAVETPPAE